MTVLVHPQSELIREPRLLVPRQVPIGPVVQNKNSLAVSSSWAYLLNGGAPNRPLFGKRGFPLTLVSTASRATSAAGMGWVATTRITGPDTLAMFPTSSGDGLGDFSLLAFADAVPSGTLTMPMHARSPADYYKSVFFVVNGYYVDAASSGTNESGTVYFGTLFFSAGINARGVAVTNRVNGIPHCWVGVRRSHVYYLFEDGRLIGSVDHGANQTYINTADQQFALGGFTTADTRAITRPLHFTAEWDFALTDGDAAALSADPFSLVSPA